MPNCTFCVIDLLDFPALSQSLPSAQHSPLEYKLRMGGDDALGFPPDDNRILSTKPPRWQGLGGVTD